VGSIVASSFSPAVWAKWRYWEIKYGSTAKKLVDYHIIIKGFIALWAPA
jgi:hypothetical protein